MHILFTILANVLALALMSRLLEGVSFEGGIMAYLLFGAIVTVLNFFVKPLMKLLTFPLVFLSGGLFLIVINAAILYIADHLLEVMDIGNIAFNADGLLTYVLAAVIFGLCNAVIHWFLKD